MIRQSVEEKWHCKLFRSMRPLPTSLAHRMASAPSLSCSPGSRAWRDIGPTPHLSSSLRLMRKQRTATNEDAWASKICEIIISELWLTWLGAFPCTVLETTDHLPLHFEAIYSFVLLLLQLFGRRLHLQAWAFTVLPHTISFGRIKSRTQMSSKGWQS